MPGADDPGGRRLDPDDWFAAAGSTPPPRPRGREADATPAAPPEPAWFEDAPEGEPGPGLLPASSLQRRRLALLGGVALVVVVVIVLAVSGVFSSSNNDGNTSPPVTPPSTPTQT